MAIATVEDCCWKVNDKIHRTAWGEQCQWMPFCLSIFPSLSETFTFFFSSPHHPPSQLLLKCKLNSQLLHETSKKNNYVVLTKHPKEKWATLWDLILTQLSHILNKLSPFLWLTFCYLWNAFLFSLCLSKFCSLYCQADISTWTWNILRSLVSTVILLLLKSYYFYPMPQQALRVYETWFLWLINRYSKKKKKRKSSMDRRNMKNMKFWVKEVEVFYFPVLYRVTYIMKLQRRRGTIIWSISHIY